MFDRVELIRVLNSILKLMFDEFCQVCSRLAIYRKMRKISLSTQFSVERYIVFINKSFSLSSHFHHQIVLIIKSFSSSNRSHYQIVFIIKLFSSSRFRHVVLIKSFSLFRFYYQAMFIKSYYCIKRSWQVNLSSQFIKSSYQVILSSRSKPSKTIVTRNRNKRS
jgi:hypothetical protein